MQELTNTQQKMFDFIRSEIDSRGIAPSVREIGRAIGLKSTSSVQHQLDCLENKGYIIRDANLKRTIRIANVGTNPTYVPLLGTVTAGMPILAEQLIEDYIPVPTKANGKKLFALKIKGDSMVNAGIYDGDVAIIEQTPVAENGEIVVALIDNEATVKRFYKENGHFRLQPENSAMEPIYADEVTVLGKVISLYRLVR